MKNGKQIFGQFVNIANECGGLGDSPVFSVSPRRDICILGQRQLGPFEDPRQQQQ